MVIFAAVAIFAMRVLYQAKTGKWVPVNLGSYYDMNSDKDIGWARLQPPFPDFKIKKQKLKMKGKRMKKTSSYYVMVNSIMKSFTDDGKLDLGELDAIIDYALQDGEIDPDEKSLLKNLFSKVTASDVDSQVWSRIEEIKNKSSL